MAHYQRRKEVTQRNQREARKNGGSVHPRGLARSVAKSYCRIFNMPESCCTDYFKDPEMYDFFEAQNKPVSYSRDSSGSRGRRIIRRA